jgi:CubicO group peptidase (beta-lactamase class C family)
MMLTMNPANSQHPTSNTQHPRTQKHPAIGCWVFDVGCWLFLRSFPFLVCFQLWVAVDVANAQPSDPGTGKDKSVPQKAAAYFPPPESKGGWRKLKDPQEIRRLGGMDPAKLGELKQWLLNSDDRPFGAVVIRNGYIVLEVERDPSSTTNTESVKSCAKAICATVLAIASEESQRGHLPRRMSFDDPAFDYIPWAQPLSDPRKAQIKVKQLLNHTSGITPEGYGIANRQKWEYILGHGGDGRTAKLFFDPGTTLEYSTHGLYHAALVCENVTGKRYDQYAIEALLKPLGIEKWWFEIIEGDEKHGSHASHTAGFPAREMARIAYCMLRDGRWGNRQVVPRWFVEQTAAPTHSVTGVTKKSFGRDARSWSHGWELPALEGGQQGEGIALDARFKPGSGGQLISFVPSLDLVLTRQTGKSGEWRYEEYVRRAAAAVLPSAGKPAQVPAAR